MRLFAITLIAVAMLIVAPAAVEAQCHDPRICAGGHRLDKEENWSLQGYHTSCDDCVFGGAEACHPSCDHQDEDVQLAYGMILEAAERLDAKTLVQLMPLLPMRLHLNAMRQSLQIANCGGTTLVANVPLTATEFAEARRLAEQLPMLTIPDEQY